ncbi:TIGR00341 family protein [Pseudanabaena sp. FACHB-2040]|uniref:TIGR00341 family protein n=1 Tax=Pseudanabaena sp. FACHB-2040 TaxID=2692859 RepID=UPI0016857722|nr:TIGR00341 family protein [Pseudanabaena sp. FACHB-2040]MBD2256947.1 TIGR00341 family protein [Pseudanabaena sp. FACHB-2040]
MRQLLIQVPCGCGKTVLQKAKDCDGTNLAQWQTDGDDCLDIVMVHVSNQKVETLLDQLQDLPDLKVTLFPTGVMALHPPADAAAQQVKQVEERSPIEIFLAGLQSVGSWKGFLSYAAMAGVVVWIGLYTATSYLLVAAMLIAPFAGPAMNTAIATARGDRQLLGRSVLRYFVALSVTIVVAALLSLIFQQQTPTPLMIEQSQISMVAVLLPLAAGAAGAINLIQSERSSLVSGAATGMLVAASLAPPAGIIGMAAAVSRWDLAVNGLFLLLLQLSGINLAAAVLFRFFGLSTRGARYQRGKRGIFPVSLGVSAIALAGLLTWQLSTSPNLVRSSRAQQANAEVQKVIEQADEVNLIESNVRFTRSNIKGQNTLLGVVYVQRQPNVEQSTEAIQAELTETIQAHLLNQGFNVTPLIDVNVLEAPEIAQSN